MRPEKNREIVISPDIFVMQTKFATIAKVDIADRFSDIYAEGWGTTKRNVGEINQPTVGVYLAVSRALVDIAENLRKAAYEMLPDEPEEETVQNLARWLQGLFR